MRVPALSMMLGKKIGIIQWELREQEVEIPELYHTRKENRHNTVGIEGTRRKRREEGRCFRCGGAYNYGHKCPDKNLRVVICGEGEDLEDEDLQHTETEEEKEDEEESDRSKHERRCMNL